MYVSCKPKKLLCVTSALLLISLLLYGVRAACAAGAVGEEAVFLPVIMYHSVYTSTPSEYEITTVQLENDLAWLHHNGYTAVTAEQLCLYTNGIGTLPEHPVLITLDDGCYNNLSELLPLLERYDMHAIVSVVGTYADNQAAADPHNPVFSYLTWEDIRVLAESGRVEIGNHTYDMHTMSGGRRGCARNSGESAEDYAAALTADVSLLQSRLHEHAGIVPFVFAYPYGMVSRESIPVLREQGILVTLTCYEEPNYITRDPKCLYGLGRYNRSGFYSTEEFMQMMLTQ